jgi:hypothetical protein
MRGVNYNHAGQYEDSYATNTRVQVVYLRDQQTAGHAITLGEFVQGALASTEGTPAFHDWLHRVAARIRRPG